MEVEKEPEKQIRPNLKTEVIPGENRSNQQDGDACPKKESGLQAAREVISQVQTEPSPNEDPEKPGGRLIITYRGAYYNRMKVNHEAMARVSEAADVRSRILITAGTKRDLEKNGEYLQLGEVAARKGYLNPEELTRKPGRHKDYEIKTDFKKGEIEIKINGEIIYDRLVAKSREHLEERFKKEFNRVLAGGIRESIRAEKMHQIHEGLKIVALTLVPEAAALFHTAIVINEIAHLTPGYIENGQLLVVAAIPTAAGMLFIENLAGLAAVEGLRKYIQQRPFEAITYKVPDYEEMPGKNDLVRSLNWVRGMMFQTAPFLEDAFKPDLRPTYFQRPGDFNPFVHLRDILRGQRELGKAKQLIS